VSIIEQAARRLEELRRSGIDIPSRDAIQAAAASPVSALPARAARRLEEVHGGEPRTTAAADGGAVREVVAPEPARVSRTVEIDLVRLAAMGYLTPTTTTRSQVADDFRVIKRPLLMNVRGNLERPVKHANLIMVTSSLPNEGKTFVAVNLAMSIAMEIDQTVLLVDADVARPSVLSRLGLETSKGFLDVLADPAMPLSDVLLRTNIPKLSILSAGLPREQATEILASDRMGRLLEEMAARYPDRIIVFDAPPLLPSTESRALATRVGQVIFVAEAKRTPERALVQALATIEACPVVLPLLNKTSRSDVGLYYGYYGRPGS
jgi:receptor protein-tyrosine kinase